MQILMQASLAIKMGVPIYGIIGMTATATDKEGRSVPAPGQGILTVAREAPAKFPSPLLDIKYRARQLNKRREQIGQWSESEYSYLDDEIAAAQSQDSSLDVAAYRNERADHIKREAIRQEKDAQNSYGNEFYKNDPTIAPLRGALAVWGLTVDDIGVASFHGTSTVANDKNESDTISKQLAHLGRSKGNALLGVFQKYLTGHPKGAAAAWMLNGAMQILNTGLVPGNKNADNVDQYLEKFSHILYPSRSIQTDGIRAVSITSFGFGQVGAQVIVIHPDYILATLESEALDTYKHKVEARHKKSYRYLHESMVHNNLINPKKSPPYTSKQESAVYLDPLARASRDKAGSWSFPAKFHKPRENGHTAETLKSLTEASGGKNVGVDVELISSINMENDTFISRNFTEAEQTYCRQAASPQSSFAGTWSAKEAVFKSLGAESKGAGASMLEIEVLRLQKGEPTVTLYGSAKAAADKSGLRTIKVSISHDENQAVAVAIAS